MKVQSVSPSDGATAVSLTSPSSPSSSPASSYYSQLLSSLTWLSSEANDAAAGESHRFARMYLKEMEQKALDQIDEWAQQQQRVDQLRNHTTQGQVDQGPSQCCRQRYIKVIRLFFEALAYLRPQFDAKAKSKHRRGD